VAYLILQNSYKTHREAETGEPAPLSLVVSDLCVMIIAGGFALVAPERPTADSYQVWRAPHYRSCMQHTALPFMRRCGKPSAENLVR